MDIDVLGIYLNRALQQGVHIDGLSLYKHQKIRKDPSALETLTIRDMRAIEAHARKSRSDVIGIDIGTGRFISASDSSMERTMEYYPEHFKAMTHAFGALVPGDQSAMLTYRTAVLEAISSFVVEAADQLIETYGDSCTFVIGRPAVIMTPVFSVIYTALHSELYMRVEKGTVDSVPERGTTITCPSCSHRSKENLKGFHSFLCAKCGFESPNDDIVAACNIAGRYITTSQGKEEAPDVLRILIADRDNIYALRDADGRRTRLSIPKGVQDAYRKYDATIQNHSHVVSPKKARAKLRFRLENNLKGAVSQVKKMSDSNTEIIIDSKGVNDESVMADILVSFLSPDRKLTRVRK